MRMPEMKLSKKYKVSNLLGNEIDSVQTAQKGCDRMYAYGLDLAALPVAKRRAKRKYISGVTGTPVLAFSNGDCFGGVAAKNGNENKLYWGITTSSYLQNATLGADNSEAPAAALATAGNKVYLPGFMSVFDSDKYAVFPLYALYNLGELIDVVEDAEEGESNRHTITFPVSTIDGLHEGQYMRLTYSTGGDVQYFGETVVKVLSVDSGSHEVSILGNADYLTEAENGTICLETLFPDKIRGMFMHHDRMYCYAGQKIYASAIGMPDCMGDTHLFDADKDGFVLDVGEDVTGGCVYNGDPVFFTANAILHLEGINTARTAFKRTPLRGVAKGMGGTLSEIGGKLCYFSDAGLTVSNGKESSVVRGTLASPAARSTAVSDGRLYYFSNEEEGGMFFGYDAARDILYCLENAHISSLQMVDAALFGVIEDSEQHTSKLTVLCGWNEFGFLRSVIDASSTLSFGEESVCPAVKIKIRLSLKDAEVTMPNQIVLDSKVAQSNYYYLRVWDGSESEYPQNVSSKFIVGDGTRQYVDFGLLTCLSSVLAIQISFEESENGNDFIFYGIALRWRK